MCGGGGGDPPPQPSPMEEAEAQRLLEEQRYQNEQKALREQREYEEKLRLEEQGRQQQKELEEAVKKQQEKDKRTQGIEQSYSSGKSYFDQMLDAYGLESGDLYGLETYYDTALSGSRQNALGTETGDYSSYFDYDALWDEAYDSATQRGKSEFEEAYEDMFDTGWQDQYFSQSSDDEILSAILGEQYNEAKGFFDAGKSRGQLSEGAYEAALRDLENKRSSADSTLQDIGWGVLSKYRTELEDISKQYGEDLEDYKLGDSWDMDAIMNSLTGRSENLKGRMRGDILTALGDTSLFNTEKMLSSANSKGGTSNTSLSDAYKEEEEKKRSTGTTGLF